MRQFRILILAGMVAPLIAIASSPLDGRWQLDKTRSTALDGWHDWQLVIHTTGTGVELRHEMKWGRTEFSATNTVDTSREVSLPQFFHVQPRHMAVYPAKSGETKVTASWIDNGRTLRVEATMPVEISQGETTMRIYSEYRLLEGDDTIELIELRSSRPQPLVYRFTRVKEGK